MKKSLGMLVGAMLVSVAPTQVFASSQTVTGTDTADYNAPVTVNGNVLNAEGSVAEGLLSVTLPTAASFMVDSYGTLTGTSLTVSNDSAVGVDVYVSNFVETVAGGGITVHPKGTSLTEMTRDNVLLTLAGNASTINLDPETMHTAPGTLVSEIAPTSSDILVLGGSAGTKEVAAESFTGSVDELGTNEEFNIVFTIKKSAE